MDDTLSPPDAGVPGQVVAAYDAAWRERDEGARCRLLEQVFAADGELIGPAPVGRVVGVPAIAAHIGRFFERWPGADVFVTTGIDGHHGWLRYGWVIRRESGEVLLQGIDVAELAADGRLRLVVMFFGPLPAPEAPKGGAQAA